VKPNGDTIAIETLTVGPASETLPASEERFERLLVALGDRLNPILVKETRQALKSRQFLLTFTLLLLFGWVWSLLGVAVIGPGVYYGSHGPTMFYGYYVILAFPLLVVVPFGAFRSLAAEQEERTYEMLSITTLGPRQIVLGKLGSAAMQMLVYLSAITPCLAFTYMLRGLSFPTILMVVFYVSLASLSLSIICLFLGTLSTEKYVQVIVSVFAIAGLFLAFFMGLQVAAGIVTFGEQMYRQSEFWITNAAIVTFVAGYFWLVFEAAAARITFASDNRATRLRAVMLAQFALWTGWMTFAWFSSDGHPVPIMIFTIFAVLHWYALGAMMTGESPELSLRVRRQLPRTALGRVFLTWFNPGPATGYVFALAGLLGTCLIAAVGLGLTQLWPARQHWGRSFKVEPMWFAVLALCYATFFLGLGVLATRALRKRFPVTIATAVLLQLVLLMVFSGVPAIVQWMSDLRSQDYCALQVASPVWTLIYVGGAGMPLGETPLLVTLVPLAALRVLLANVRVSVKELRFVRIAAPARVAEEDAAAAAAKSPPVPARKSPWDR